MAKITFPIKELQKYFAINESVADKISLFGTTVESISEKEIELEIPANRPDLLSLSRFAKAFTAFQGKNIGLTDYPIKKSQYIVNVDSSVKNVRPYTACAVVTDLVLSKEKIEEIISLQEKLHTTIGRNRKRCAIGIYPMEKISFPIKYEARKPADIIFIPLGMNKELNALQILQKHPAGRKYARLLEKNDKFPIFIDSTKKILSMPPIINSAETGEVNPQTKNLFIECSGSDKDLQNRVLAIISTTLADYGGKIHSVSLQGSQREITPDLTPTKTELSKENVIKLLGLDLSEKEIRSLLAKMGHEYKKSHVQSPAWRIDILHEVDLIEDIAIAYGYDKIPAELPMISTIGSPLQKTEINNKIISSLIGLGFLETSSLHLVTLDEARKHRNKPLILENARTEFAALRPDLTIPAMRTLSQNTSNEYPQKICEIGKVFVKDDESETGVKEETHLMIAITPGNFTEAKQALNYLASSLNISYELKESAEKPFIDGRTAEIIMSGNKSGIIGEVHPASLRSLSLKLPLAIIELNLEHVYSSLKVT